MALPPTPLKELLYSCSDADEAFDRLVEAGCLRRRARDDREGLRALWAQARAQWDTRFGDKEGWTGPNTVDVFTDLLESSGVLSRKGRRMATD